jgi:hypothetical protein
MAEDSVSDSFDVTRRQLRRHLLPEAGAEFPEILDVDDDHFPRSKVMRFAFNPRNRRLLVISGSVLAVLATRVVGANGVGLVADIARSLTRNKS